MGKFIKNDIHSISDVIESINKNKKIYVVLLFYFIAMLISPIMLRYSNNTLSLIGIILFLAGCICGIVSGIRVLMNR